jgi:hypothetical protein
MSLTKRIEQLEAKMPPREEEDCPHPRMRLRGVIPRLGTLRGDEPVIKGYCSRCGFKWYLYQMNVERESEAREVWSRLNGLFGHKDQEREYELLALKAITDGLLGLTPWPPTQEVIDSMREHNPEIAVEGYVY